MGEFVKSFKCGACEAAIFENEFTTKAGKDVKIKKVVLQKRYRDKDDEWASTNSFDVNDIPKARLALDEAYRFLMLGDRAEGNRDVIENGEDR